MADKKPEQLLAEEQEAHKRTQNERDNLKAALEREIAEHKKTKATSLNKINSLQQKAQSAKTGKGGVMPTGEVDGKKYRARYPKIKIGDKVCTADEVMADQELMKTLLKNRSSFMIDVEAEQAAEAKKAKK
jgi:hypothetical protein